MPRQFLHGKLSKLPQIVTLASEIHSTGLEPIPLHRRTMNAEWSAQRIPQFARTEHILSRKYLDTIRLLPVAFNGHTQPQGDVVNEDSSGFG